jgi:hypothetical protein
MGIYRMRRILIILVFLLLVAAAVFAQNNRGSITGSITDSAGALMPGVRVEARNTETDALFQVASNSTGTYTIAQLPAGTYQISVSIPGFKQYVRTGIAVVEAQVMRIDIVMVMLSSDEILTNESVIQLLKAGIEEDLIISKIRENQHNFDLSVQGMVALKEGGVSNRLMRIIMDPTKASEAKAAPAAKTAVAPEQPAPPPVTPAPPSVTPAAPKEPPKTAEASTAGTDPGFPTEIGVHVKSGKQWVQIQPEVIIWQTGGMFKRFATAGIVQGDVNGRIKGATSSNVVKTPLEFIIVAPEGVDISEYQLIHMRELRDAREFRTVTGGIFSSSGGATRDAIQFEGTKVSSRTYSVKLTKLDVGEYGFLPTSTAATGSAANVGKMYTFQVSDIINR